MHGCTISFALTFEVKISQSHFRLPFFAPIMPQVDPRSGPSSNSHLETWDERTHSNSAFCIGSPLIYQLVT